MSLRDMVSVTVIVVVVATVLAALPAPGIAQSPGDEWRVRFAAGEEARRAGDHESYAREMAAAARALPAGQLNRPFVQYHAARGAALSGRPDEAFEWLRTAWEEEIESLMISFAPYDPAFAAVVETPGFLKLPIFVVKVFLLVFFFIWERATFPRFRYDQVMRLGWKVLMPIALANVFVTGLYYVVTGATT